MTTLTDDTGFGEYARADTKPAVHYDMPARVYHSDADGPRLSQSLATTCVHLTPLHAWQTHPLLGAAGYRFTPNTDDGTIMHSLILEPDSDDIEEIDPSTIRTKDGKIAKSPFATEEGKVIRDQALAAGRIPLLTEVLGAYRYKAKALRQRLEAHPTRPVVFDGKSEVVIYWTEQTPSGPVRCRCRLDHLTECDGKMRIIDLKTTDKADRESAKRQAWQLGYEIQHAAYVRAVEAAFPAFAGRVEMVFAFVELEKPWAVAPYVFGGKFARLGEVRWERGRDLWAAALERDEWAGYDGGELDPPGWSETSEMAVQS